jgi:uncharacterized protein YaiE (UPF0345 family)
MSVFENVTVVREANVYFEGKVTSRTVVFADGSKKTLGIMLPGEYTFGTDAAEVMEILSGQLDVLLPGQDAWQAVKGGDTFNVQGKASFSLRVSEVTDYCCAYVAG